MSGRGGDDAPAGGRRERFTERFAEGHDEAIERAVPIEAPVSIEINGIAYAVMMATPEDLCDFAVGFAVAERLIAPGDAAPDADIVQVEAGWVVRIGLPAARDAVLARVRRRVAESSCGLCGIENLEAVARPLPRVAHPLSPTPEAVFAALGALRGHQALGRATGAAHAAAFCRPDGVILTVREDVGRHNALDKLTGALLRSGARPDEGFALLTARCSYELVEKAVLAGYQGLATISAPTSLALDRARAAGLPLVALARSDSGLWPS